MGLESMESTNYTVNHNMWDTYQDIDGCSKIDLTCILTLILTCILIWLQLSAHIDAWVVSQIVKHEERKWGSLVSAKLFMDREYVVKHIHNKHQAVIKKEKEKVCGPSMLLSRHYPRCRCRRDQIG